MHASVISHAVVRLFQFTYFLHLQLSLLSERRSASPVLPIYKMLAWRTSRDINKAARHKVKVKTFKVMAKATSVVLPLTLFSKHAHCKILLLLNTESSQSFRCKLLVDKPQSRFCGLWRQSVATAACRALETETTVR